MTADSGTCKLVQLLRHAFRVLRIIVPAASSRSSRSSRTSDTTGDGCMDNGRGGPNPAHAPAASPSSAPRKADGTPTEWTGHDRSAVGNLLQAVAQCLHAAEEQTPAFCAIASPQQQAAYLQDLECVADWQPFSVLCDVMSLWGVNQTDLPALGLQAAVLLLRLATRSAHLAGGLLSQVQDTRVLPLVCGRVAEGLSQPPGATGCTADSHLHAANDADALLDTWDVLLRRSVDAPQLAALQSLAGGTPGLGRLLLAGLKLRLQDERPGSITRLKTGLAAACRWFAAQPAWSPTNSSTTASHEGDLHGSKAPHNSSEGSSSVPEQWHAAPAPLPAPVAPARPWAVTAENAFDVAAGVGRHAADSSLTRVAFLLIHSLWLVMSPGEQARAFMPVAQVGLRFIPFVRRMLLLPRPPGSLNGSGDPSSTHVRVGSARGAVAAPVAPLVAHAGGNAEAQLSAAGQADLLEDALVAVQLMVHSITPSLSGTTQDAVQGTFKWDQPQLLPRARWLCRSGAVGACEALLRAVPDWLSAAGPVLSLGLTSAALLLSEPLAPQALTDFHSLAATLRKQLARGLREQAAAAASAALSTPAPAHDCDADPLEWSGAAGASHRATAACVKLCTARLEQLVGHHLLRPCWDAGPRAAPSMLLRCAALQLLPLAVRAAASHVGRVGLIRHVTVFPDLLHIIAYLNEAGLGDLTAAAGAPRLLSALLSAAAIPDLPPPPEPEAGSTGDGDSGGRGEGGDGDGGNPQHLTAGSAASQFASGPRIAVLCGVVLMAAGADPVWHAESRRLKGLPSRAIACLALDSATASNDCQAGCEGAQAALLMMAPALALRIWPEGSSSVGLAQGLGDALSQQQSEEEVQADSSADLHVPPATLDRYLLHAAAEQAAVGGDVRQGAGVSVPPCGCWNLRCTNLDGETEAAVKTRACAGCLHARYCSAACQRTAWRNGHRAACQSWVAQLAAAGAAAGAETR